MATFLEFHLKGGGCAVVDTSTICGAIARGHDVWAPGVADAPTLVVLRSGEHLEVIGESVGKVIARIVQVRQLLKAIPGAEVYVDWITPLSEEAQDAADDQRGG